LDFLERFSEKKKDQISIFIKIRPMRAELLHEDVLTDMTQLIVAFRNFANTPKNKTMTEASIRKYLPTFLHEHVMAKIMYVNKQTNKQTYLHGYDTFFTYRRQAVKFARSYSLQVEGIKLEET
jgi:hypothetical protein